MCFFEEYINTGRARKKMYPKNTLVHLRVLKLVFSIMFLCRGFVLIYYDFFFAILPLNKLCHLYDEVVLVVTAMVMAVVERYQ